MFLLLLLIKARPKSDGTGRQEKVRDRNKEEERERRRPKEGFKQKCIDGWEETGTDRERRDGNWKEITRGKVAIFYSVARPDVGWWEQVRRGRSEVAGP